MSDRFFRFLGDLIIDYRWLTLAFVIGMTGFTFIGHYDPHLIVSEAEPEPEGESEFGLDYERLKDEPAVNPIRIGLADVIVVAESDDFFTPTGADAIRASVAALEDLDQVNGLLWMDRAPILNIFGLPEPILPNRNASLQRFEQAKERALKHPLVVGQLLSEDAKTLMLMVRLNWLAVESDRQCTDLLRETAENAAQAFSDVSIRFRITGRVPIQLGRAGNTHEAEFRYQVTGYTIAAIMAFILFRGVTAVMIVAIAPIAGVFWTIGVIHFIGLDQNPFNWVVVPVLLCMVAFTDGVHMMVQIRRHRLMGLSSADAAKESVREVGTACWLTSLTTAIGFMSLSLADNDTVREFGYCCSIGVFSDVPFCDYDYPDVLRDSVWKERACRVREKFGGKKPGKLGGLIDFVRSPFPHTLYRSGRQHDCLRRNRLAVAARPAFDQQPSSQQRAS